MTLDEATKLINYEKANDQRKCPASILPVICFAGNNDGSCADCIKKSFDTAKKLVTKGADTKI